jgi:hypothetical protein
MLMTEVSTLGRRISSMAGSARFAVRRHDAKA